MNKIRPLIVPIACSLLTLLFTALAGYQIDSRHHQTLTARFQAASGEVGRTLQARLDEDAALLTTITAYRRSSPEGDLATFLGSMLQAHAPAGLKALSVAPLILPENRDQFLASQQQRTPGFVIRPGGVRPLSAPVVLSVAPPDQLAQQPGTDLLADNAQQQALTSARDSGQPALSGHTQLPAGNGEMKPGFIIAAPRFANRQTPDNVADRRAAIEGWEVAAFDFDDWLRSALEGQPAGLTITLHEGEAGTNGAVIHPSTNAAGTSLLESETTLRLGEHRWTARLHAGPAFTGNEGAHPARLVAIAGVALAALVFFTGLALSRARYRDKEETERLQEALRESEERWRFALEGAGDGVWEWDVRSGSVSFSPRCDTILGMSDGNASKARIHPDDEAAERAAMQACLEGRSEQYASEHRMQGEDGVWRWIDARAMVTLRTATGTALRMIGTVSDITERKVARERLQDMPQMDSLTGLPNRTLFFDRLQQGLRMVKRQRETLALIYADIDNFKHLVDNFGQTVSNKLLQGVATRITGAIRESDTVAHLGRDDFVILLPSMTDEKDVHIVLEKIRNALLADFVIHDRHIGVTLSFGVSLFPQHARNAESLFNAAQRAVQQARKSGGNTVVFSLAQ